MSYLDRLKRLESGEIFHNPPEPEPTKPTKGGSEWGSDGFVGSIPGPYEKIHSEIDASDTGERKPLNFKKCAYPLPTKPSKGIGHPLRVLSPSGKWYFTRGEQ